MSAQVCPNCGSPRMEGTGLFLCGEGMTGNVVGGCRVPYTAARIKALEAERDEARLWFDEAAIRCTAVEADLAAAREALERIANDAEAWYGPTPEDRADVLGFASVARAALAVVAPAEERT